MKQVAAYTDKDEDGKEEFYSVLSCGCTLHVQIDDLFEADLPCPLHEEHRFTGDPPPNTKPHVET